VCWWTPSSRRPRRTTGSTSSGTCFFRMFHENSRSQDSMRTAKDDWSTSSGTHLSLSLFYFGSFSAYVSWDLMVSYLCSRYAWPPFILWLVLLVYSS
jgi:hypothetical protein